MASDSSSSAVYKQIKYYFSDNNLVHDRFMKQKVSENEGWIELDCLCTFNRLKKLSTDHKFILQSIIDLCKDEFFEVDQEKSRIRRNPKFQLPSVILKEYRYQHKDETLILKGFPATNDIDIAVIEEILTKLGYPNTVEICLVKNKERTFIGQVYVQFENRTIADKFLKENSQFKYGESDIRCLTHDQFKQEKDEKKFAKSRERFYELVGYDSENLKTGIRVFAPGKLLKFTGTTEDITRELLKEQIKEPFSIDWVHFNKGDKNGVLQFKNANEASEFLDNLKKTTDSDELALNEQCKLKLEVLEGQDEINYWRDILFKKSKKQASKHAENNLKRKMKDDPKIVKSQAKITKFDDSNEE